MRKELVVKRQEKLGYVKSNSACIDNFDLFWTNEMNKSDFSINSQILFKST